MKQKRKLSEAESFAKNIRSKERVAKIAVITHKALDEYMREAPSELAYSLASYLTDRGFIVSGSERKDFENRIEERLECLFYQYRSQRRDMEERFISNISILVENGYVERNK